jgi:hypothetical protein
MNDVITSRSVSQVSQNALVNGTAYMEPEAGVKTVTLISKVLVRKELEKHGRHIRLAGLII